MYAKRVSMGLAATALALSWADPVLAQPAPAMPPEYGEAIGDWGSCGGRAAGLLAMGSDSAEAILVEISKQCAAEEAKLRAAATKFWGADAPAVVAENMRISREQSLEIITAARTRTAVSDPSVAWGQCVGRQVRAIGTKGDTDAIIEKAFAACAVLDNETQAFAEARVGHDRAIAIMDQVRGIVRDQLVKAIAKMRQGQH